MRMYLAPPVKIFLPLWRNRELVAIPAKREVWSSYHSLVMNNKTIELSMVIFNQSFMLSEYIFAFSKMLKTRQRPVSVHLIENRAQ